MDSKKLLSSTLEKDYENRIHKPMQLILQDYNDLANLAIMTTQHAEKFRKEVQLYEYKNKQLMKQNEELLDDLESVNNKFETAVAKHNIARGHFQKELKELNKFREQRDNFYEVIQLCKELLANENVTLPPSSSSGVGTQSTTDSDTASIHSAQNLAKTRLSVAQINKLKSFNVENLYDEEDLIDNMDQSYLNPNRKNKINPYTTPRQGRPLGTIDESNSFDVTFDSEPDTEPDHHSTGLGDITNMAIPQMPSQARLNESRLLAHTYKHSPGFLNKKNFRKRYSSDAVLSTATLSTGESSSLAAGADAGCYQAKKFTSANGTRRRPSNQFRRRSQIKEEAEEGIALNKNGGVNYWPSDSSTPMVQPKKVQTKRKSCEMDRDLTPTNKRISPKRENVTKKLKITPPSDKKPPIAVAVTPLAKKELSDIKKTLKRRHEWVHKTGIITGPKCAISNRKIKFNKAMWRCARCGMVVHPDSFDQAVKTECTAQMVKQPTLSNLKRQVSQDFLNNFSTNHHNILLTIEEIERRRAFLCEGMHRISGNVKEKNGLVNKIAEHNSSLAKKRHILANLCKDHNSLSSCLKHYLSEEEPLLTYKLLPTFAKIATDESLSATERKRLATKELEKLPENNLQVLSVVLRHLNHVIENRNVNKMSDESMARAIGPSLIGYQTPNPTTQDLQTAHHYQRNVALCLLNLPNTGNCLLGKHLKKIEERQRAAQGIERSNSKNLDKSIAAVTPMTMRRMFGLK